MCFGKAALYYSLCLRRVYYALIVKTRPHRMFSSWRNSALTPTSRVGPAGTSTLRPDGHTGSG